MEPLKRHWSIFSCALDSDWYARAIRSFLFLFYLDVINHSVDLSTIVIFSRFLLLKTGDITFCVEKKVVLMSPNRIQIHGTLHSPTGLMAGIQTQPGWDHTSTEKTNILTLEIWNVEELTDRESVKSERLPEYFQVWICLYSFGVLDLQEPVEMSPSCWEFDGTHPSERSEGNPALTPHCCLWRLRHVSLLWCWWAVVKRPRLCQTGRNCRWMETCTVASPTGDMKSSHMQVVSAWMETFTSDKPLSKRLQEKRLVFQLPGEQRHHGGVCSYQRISCRRRVLGLCLFFHVDPGLLLPHTRLPHTHPSLIWFDLTRFGGFSPASQRCCRPQMKPCRRTFPRRRAFLVLPLKSQSCLLKTACDCKTWRCLLPREEDSRDAFMTGGGRANRCMLPSEQY